MISNSLVTFQEDFFTLAQRAFCAAAIFLRLAAEIVLLGLSDERLVFCFAQRAFCARLIFLRAAALILWLVPAAVPDLVWLDSISRSAFATLCSFAISASTSPSIPFMSKCPPSKSEVWIVQLAWRPKQDCENVGSGSVLFPQAQLTVKSEVTAGRYHLKP
jgi:hypothetical protein